jgi:branched-chain amino acid transport system permease protein
MEQISPFMGFPFTIGSFVVVILGGLGNLGGGMVAGIFLGVVETYVVAMTSPSLRAVLVNGIFMIALFVRPEGLLSVRRTSR